METYHGHVRTPNDAILLFEACRIGLLPRVQRRLSEKERQQIKSGSVFVWDEREAGMRRWTDGKSWSASRVSGSFLALNRANESNDAMHSTTPIEETMTIRQLHQRLREMQNQLDALRGSQVVDAQERMISLADEVVSLRRHILSLEERQQSLSDEIFPPPHYWHRYDTSSAW